MNKSEATAEVFLTALRALPAETRKTIYSRLAEDRKLMEDLMDIALHTERMKQSFRPLREIIKEIK